MSSSNKNGKKGNYDKNNLWHKYNLKWVVVISIWTFFLTILISILSEAILTSTGILISLLILFIIIFIGVAADMVGIAVTASEERPFHAMAADKVVSAKCAIGLLKNAGKVSNFCNDVIGDICGIVSGTASASIILQLNQLLPINRAFMTIALTGFVASLTVGGKAIGKNIAIRNSQKIVFQTAKVLNFIYRKFGINLIPTIK